MKAPPLLLGACMLLWGWQTEHLLFGIPMAIVLEGARWLPWRWDFQGVDFNRVADFSSVLFLVMVAYQFNERGIHGIYAILGLLPLILYLLIVSQYYSRQGGVPLSALFVSLRRKHSPEPHPDDRDVDLAYPYALVCLLSASSGTRTIWFYVALCAVIGWMLWPARPRRYWLPVWLSVLVVACALGFAAQHLIREAQELVERGVLLWFNERMWASTDAGRATTAIGTIGRLKLSDSIRLRVRSERPIAQPLLLREASYDIFGYGNWRTTEPEFYVIDADRGGGTWPLSAAGTGSRRLSITTRFRKEISVIPVPYGASRIYNPDILVVQNNSYDAIRIELPPGQINYEVVYEPGRTPVSPPTDAALELPDAYAADMRAIAMQLGLGAMEPAAAIGALRQYFAANFRYSMIQRGSWPGRMPLTDFLRRTHKGHCEYFATATVLLLRAAGIPARYTVGYSVSEYSELEEQYIARARHAHAWAEAWVDGGWQVVDTTPSQWAELEQANASGLQGILDLVSWLGYQFNRIRNGEAGIGNIYLWLLIPLLAILAWRLYRRERVARDDGGDQSARRSFAAMGLDSEFLALVDHLDEQGFKLRPGEPLGPWVRRLLDNHDSEMLKSVLEAILKLHYRYRFDPRGISEHERDRLRSSVQECLSALARGSHP